MRGKRRGMCEYYASAVAVTRVANKMLTIIWHMLTDNNLYDDRNESRYRAKLKAVMTDRS